MHSPLGVRVGVRLDVELVVHRCGRCGIVFAVGEPLPAVVHCPAGHARRDAAADPAALARLVLPFLRVARDPALVRYAAVAIAEVVGGADPDEIEGMLPAAGGPPPTPADAADLVAHFTG